MGSHIGTENNKYEFLENLYFVEMIYEKKI